MNIASIVEGLRSGGLPGPAEAERPVNASRENPWDMGLGARWAQTSWFKRHEKEGTLRTGVNSVYGIIHPPYHTPVHTPANVHESLYGEVW